MSPEAMAKIGWEFMKLMYIGLAACSTTPFFSCFMINTHIGVPAKVVK
jgi:hypothetical protein